MAKEKNILTKHIQKHDIEANWIKAKNYVPEKGQFIIYDTDESYSYPRYKIGDGVFNPETGKVEGTLVTDLPFADDHKSQIRIVNWEDND